MNTITIPQPGQRVGVVCGPGEFPADKAGTVLCQISDKWGTHAVVLMDDGSSASCHGLSDIGIGWHLLDKGLYRAR